MIIVAEIGLNHNGCLRTAKRLVDAAVFAGADAVKFQMRTPELCVPREQWSAERDTPWGRMTYIEYRRRMEFGAEQYRELNAYCEHAAIAWSASVWDVVRLEELAGYNPPWVKIPSARITDTALLRLAADRFGHVVISTGMSSEQEVDSAVSVLEHARVRRLTILHCHSAYPAPTEELNLRVIPYLRARYPEHEIGYSGHEFGIRPTYAAVALGATFVERHITLDHDMWGTDQRASVMPVAFSELVRHIRSLEHTLGDGVKRVWESELPARAKLRGVA